MSKTYSVALIGCGKRAREHVKGLQADDRCRVVALSDVSIDAANALNADYGFGAAVYTDHRQLLEREKPEVVVASLPTGFHLPVFRDCAGAGVRAVLSEKPMAATWGETHEMARIAEESGCQLTFCHQRRFASGNRLARQWISDGRFGEIKRMDLYSPRHLLDCGTHTFDQAMSFNSESPARWALGAVDVSQPINYFGVPAEAMAVGHLVFENGVRANIQVGGPDMDLPSGVRVTGTNGFLEVLWDGQFRDGRTYDDPTWRPETLPDTTEGHMLGVVRNAIDSLQSGAEPELSYKKALRAAEVIFALYESVRRHERIELPLKDVDDSPFITMLNGGEFARRREA
jgi:predicted dehydrogenase